MNVIDKIKHIIDTNNITDEDILELRTYFSSIFTSDESQAWEEANEMAHDQFLQETFDEYEYEEYFYDPIEEYFSELAWDKQQEIEAMYKNHFSSGSPNRIIHLDHLWFTSDETEAFREIWQRRISAI